MSNNSIEFPKDFLWGTAVCSHQAEGHNVNSDWWEWEKKGKIADGSVSGAAADMLNRYPEDFKLMSDLGYNSFRFSVEWARVEPERGVFSEDALSHYEKVLDELRARGLKACLTLYHWPLPKWMAKRGGWTAEDSPELFSRFVKKVAERVYGKVDIWCTLNEPMVPVIAGHLFGEFPPERRSWNESRKAFKNLLKAHVEARRRILDAWRRTGESDEPLIGIAQAVVDVAPVNPDNILDSSIHKFIRFFHNDAFPLAMSSGKVPPPFGFNEKISGLKDSFNYSGINYYTRMRINFNLKKIPGSLNDFLYLPDGVETTAMGYEVYPPGFYNVIKDAARYGKPVYILENGIADATDAQRPGYLLRHLKQVKRAIEDGLDVRGYFQWSYIDNFEWKLGFEKKFGLVEMEPGTLNRKPRPSAYMYGEIARSGKITRELAEKFAPSVIDEVFEN
jgi:beta-glucosidase